LGGWVVRGSCHTRVRGWRGSFSQGFGIGVWRRGSGCVLRCWRAGGTDLSDTGRMKRSLRVIAVQSAGREEERRSGLQQTLGDYCNLTIFRGHVSSDTVLYQEGLIAVRRAYDSRSRLRVGVLQALAWYRTPHSQRRTCTASASNAVRRCVRKKGWACGKVPWRADTVGQLAARWTESASRALSLAAWEVAVRHG
jgi:hypothetical protein